MLHEGRPSVCGDQHRGHLLPWRLREGPCSCSVPHDWLLILYSDPSVPKRVIKNGAVLSQTSSSATCFQGAASTEPQMMCA